MPVTAAGATSGAVLIKTTYDPAFADAVYNNNKLFSLFPAPVRAGGDTAYRWKVRGAGNTSVETFVEGQGSPVAGNQRFYNAAVSWQYFRAEIQITGHARDSLQSSYLPGDILETEMTLAMQEIKDLMTTTWMGSTVGLEVAVDSTSTYAGITRGSATYFESLETAHSALLSDSGLLDFHEALRDNDRGAEVGLILSPENQATNYYRLIGGPATKQTTPGDSARNLSNQSFNGIPWVGIGDMTDTIILFLDMRPGMWTHQVIRPFEVNFQGRAGDSDVYEVSTGNALVCRNPKLQGKLTGVTA